MLVLRNFARQPARLAAVARLRQGPVMTQPAPWDQGTYVAATGRLYRICAGASTTTLIGVNPAAEGAAGDVLDQLWIYPAVLTTLGAVQVLDDATVVWVMPVTTLFDLRPIFVPINARSLNGAWRVTVPNGMAATAIGMFS